MITIIPYDESIMKDKIKMMWDLHHKSAPLLDFIFNDLGFAAVEEGRMVASLFIYPLGNTPVCWIGWPITNKMIDSKVRSEALDLLYKHVIKFCKAEGLSVIMTASNLFPVGSRLKKLGFVPGDTGMTHYLLGV